MQKTVVVLGCYRGGTSMVAAVLKSLGVFMGERFGLESEGSNQEDVDFQGKPPEVLRELIAKRNAEHDVWGWKDPGLIFNIKDVEGDIRAPHYITIFRDPLAIAESEMKRNRRPLMTGLITAMGHTQAVGLFASNTKSPNLMTSYEKAMKNKEAFVDSIINFLGLNVSEEDRNKAMQSMTYGRYTPA